MVALIDHNEYEITTFRKESDYLDGRRPSKVEFTDDLTEDLSRRDFTINAMAYNHKEGLIDPFDGRTDLKASIIRCVGDPNERFSEDALRMLRAIRFSAKYGFVIHPTTYNAILNNRQLVYKLSKERVQKEFVKTLTSPHPEYMKLWVETKLTEILMPEFEALFKTPQQNPHHIYNVGDHTMKALQHSENIKEVRLAVFFHDFGKVACRQRGEDGKDRFHGHPAVSENLAKSIMKNMHFDNSTIDTVVKLVAMHENRFDASERNVRRFLSANGKELFNLLLYVQEADIYGQAPLPCKKDDLLAIGKKRVLADKLEKEEGQLKVSSLAINGYDLMNKGLKGKEIGDMLQNLLNAVLENPDLNNKKDLLDLTEQYTTSCILEPDF